MNDASSAFRSSADDDPRAAVGEAAAGSADPGPGAASGAADAAGAGELAAVESAEVASGGHPPDHAPGTPAKPARRARAILLTAAKVLLLVLMVAFAGYALAKNWGRFTEALRELNPWVAVVSLPPVALAMFCAAQVWRTLLSDLGAPIPAWAAARIFFISQLGKYLPGSVWSIATQMELGRQYKVPRRVGFAVGVLALLLTAAVGLPVAVVTLPLAAPDVLGKYWWGMLAIPFLLAFLHPRVLGPLANFGFKLIRQPKLPKLPSLPGISKAAGWQVLVSVCFGVHAAILLVGLGAPIGSSLLAAIGGYALAYALGLLAIPLPAGLGVRDGVLLATFATVVSGPQAAVVVVLSRVALTVIDITLASGFLALSRRVKAKS
ncbi:lysylphosphatidylglycerol synthase transmembrane domain-containing protein [Cryptosporangium sp. NPDC051539]|uniref:lysylphosphatidylglycerol synthase transmembrane domain-containing protein n=1 Tax=Cryptosporangium sp. NPDC051539 TaxID=3363962 RepID=UPI00379355FC